MAKDNQPTAVPTAVPTRAPAPAAPEAHDEVAELRREVANLRRVVAEEKSREEKSLGEQEDIKKRFDKGAVALTQEAADRQFPGGKFRWWCVLPDRNGHPRILVSADNETDAKGRYLAVCGVNHTEKQVQVERA